MDISQYTDSHHCLNLFIFLLTPLLSVQKTSNRAIIGLSERDLLLYYNQPIFKFPKRGCRGGQYKQRQIKTVHEHRPRIPPKPSRPPMYTTVYDHKPILACHPSHPSLTQPHVFTPQYEEYQRAEFHSQLTYCDALLSNRLMREGNEDRAALQLLSSSISTPPSSTLTLTAPSSKLSLMAPSSTITSLAPSSKLNSTPPSSSTISTPQSSKKTSSLQSSTTT